MKCFICECLLLLVCLQYNFGLTEAADECELPGGSRGECVELAACAQYVTLLKESTTTELGLKLTQERRCGLDGKSPKVCCPTETEVPDPDPKSRTNLDDSDYVDQLPDPDNCGRRYVEFGPYVYNGKPVKTHMGYEAWVKGKDAQDIWRHDLQYPTQSDFASNNPVLSRRRRTIWNGIPAKTHKAPNTDGFQPTFGDHGTPQIGSAAGGKPVIGHDANFSNGALSDEDYPPVPQYAVAGGFPVIRQELAQWMALLAYERSPSMWECGGSIITKRHVLTAAHCIRESLYVVRVGELDLAKTEKEFNPIDFYIKKKIPHEQYHKYHNDIAILVLDGTIPFDDPYSAKYLAPVCLPEPGFPYEKQGPTSTFITGWGETEKNDRPTNLLYAYLNIVDQDACKQAYSDEALTIDERVFCAGDPSNGRDACNGDSGGPLIGEFYLPDYHRTHYYQVGLISYGYRCSAKRFTGVYTNITHFMPWILEKVTGKGPRQWTYTTQPSILPFSGGGGYKKR